MIHCPQAPRQLLGMESKWKTKVELAPNCPRCASSNTKFCYYNNYSLSQPRYFCKSCRRYWTKGGTLRNVPVGGGCRKNRRSRSSSRSNEKPTLPGYQTNNNNNSPISPIQTQSDRTSDIDLAAVFAKFLNQSSGSENEPAGGESFSITGNDGPLTKLDSALMMECHEPSDHFLIDEGPLLDGVDQILFDQKLTQVSSNEANSYGFQTFEEFDVLWSDVHDLPWQEPVDYCYQQIESFSASSSSCEINYNNQNNLFDPSIYEIFSRP